MYKIIDKSRWESFGKYNCSEQKRHFERSMQDEKDPEG
jgi:hypothetical protein